MSLCIPIGRGRGSRILVKTSVSSNLIIDTIINKQNIFGGEYIDAIMDYLVDSFLADYCRWNRN